MAAFFNDTFTEGAKTAITSHTSDSGHTWVLFAGATPVPDVYSTLGGVAASGSASPQAVRTSVIAPNADVSVTATVLVGGQTGTSFGLIARANAAGNAAYLAAHLPGTDQWGIFRVGASLSTTQLGSLSGTIDYANNATPTVEFIVTGSGATVFLEIKVNGSSVLTATDTDAARITTAGYIGLWFNSATSVASGWLFNTLSADDVVSGASISITTPVSRKINQTTGTTGTVSVTGNYTGTPTTIEARLVQHGTNTPLSSFDWATKVASPSGGTYSFNFSNVPNGGWYNVQVRHSNDTAVNATSGRVGVGDLIAFDGQSNVWLFFSPTAYAGDSSLTPNDLLAIAGKQPTSWDVPNTATMNGAISCGNELISALGYPVGLIDGTLDGGGLTVSAGAGKYMNGSSADAGYTSSAAAISAETTSIAANVWYQGNTDAASAVSQSTYYTALSDMIALRRTDVGNASLPYIVVLLGRNTNAVNDTNWQNIRKAQIQKCADSNIYRVDPIDLPQHTDGIHHSAAGFTELGKRIARAILKSKGVVSTYRGPRISQVNKVSGNVFDVVLTHDMGTDFTPSTGITGFRVLESGTPVTISSAVRQTANTIRLTLASSPATLPTVQYLYGAAPTITSVAKDNGTLTLPLEANDGVVATIASLYRKGRLLLSKRRR